MLDKDKHYERGIITRLQTKNAELVTQLEAANHKLDLAHVLAFTVDSYYDDEVFASEYDIREALAAFYKGTLK